MVTFPAAGLFGKIPAHGDFVRVRAADAVARALVLWLEEGSEAAKRSGPPGGSEPVRFLFRPPGAAHALVGLLVASADKVGRRFPLALFAEVHGAELASTFPILPRVVAVFLDAATSLAAEASTLAAPEIAARVQRLPLPGPTEIAAATAEARVRATESGRDLLARLFGDAANGQRLYALHCFRTACRAVRGGEPTRDATVLDCPVRCDLDQWVWLELARRGLGWQVPPSFFWAEPPQSRLLLSLGPAPASVFGALWRAGASGPRIWSLWTERQEAITSAQRTLGDRTVRALDREGLSLADLFDVVMP